MSLDLDKIFEQELNMSLQELFEEENYYAGGFYVIEKNGKPIYSDYFIFENINSEYKADKKIWERHINDFKNNPYSQLNESIGDIFDNDVKIFIEEFTIFESVYSFNDIKDVFEEQLQIVRESYYDFQNCNVTKKILDPYNMQDLITELDNIVIEDRKIGIQHPLYF